MVQADWELHYVVCCWGCVEGPAAPLLRYMDVSAPLLAALEALPPQALPPYFRYLASLVHMVSCAELVLHLHMVFCRSCLRWQVHERGVVCSLAGGLHAVLRFQALCNVGAGAG